MLIEHSFHTTGPLPVLILHARGGLGCPFHGTLIQLLGTFTSLLCLFSGPAGQFMGPLARLLHLGVCLVRRTLGMVCHSICPFGGPPFNFGGGFGDLLLRIAPLLFCPVRQPMPLGLGITATLVAQMP